jgi:hypothetical protein
VCAALGECGVCVCFCVSGNISTKLCGTKSSEHTHADQSNYARLLGVVRECVGEHMCQGTDRPEQKQLETNSSERRSAVHPNVAHLLCEVCWCVWCVSGISWTKPGGKKPSEH